MGNLTKLEDLRLSYNQFAGVVPIEFTNFVQLKTLYLDNNQLTDLPDLSPDTNLTELQIHMNKFTFDDIEPNLFVTSFIYSPQDSVGVEMDTTLALGASLTLSVSVGGTANQYQWMRDGEEILDANTSSYEITSADSADAGSYICRITNTIATNLTLFTRPINVFVSGSMGNH